MEQRESEVGQFEREATVDHAVGTLEPTMDFKVTSMQKVHPLDRAKENIEVHLGVYVEARESVLRATASAIPWCVSCGTQDALVLATVNLRVQKTVCSLF